jgi:hypothetical protein
MIVGVLNNLALPAIISSIRKFKLRPVSFFLVISQGSEKTRLRRSGGRKKREKRAFRRRAA